MYVCSIRGCKNKQIFAYRLKFLVPILCCFFIFFLISHFQAFFLSCCELWRVKRVWLIWDDYHLVCIKSRGLSSSHDPYDIRLDLFDSVSLMKTPHLGADGGTGRRVFHIFNVQNRCFCSFHVDYLLGFVLCALLIWSSVIAHPVFWMLNEL